VRENDQNLLAQRAAKVRLWLEALACWTRVSVPLCSVDASRLDFRRAELQPSSGVHPHLNNLAASKSGSKADCGRDRPFSLP